jgi:ribokinase
MNRSDVAVLGSFMMDLVIRVPRRPGPGETVVGSGFEMFLGGKGFNQAIAAARAGAATAMIGYLGRDEFGGRFEAQLEADGIDATYVYRHDEVGTGIGNPVVEDSGENSIVVVPRANHCLRPAHVAEAAGLIRATPVLLVQFELPFDTVVAAARIAKASGVTVICNPAPATAGIDDLRGLVDIIVPNEVEAALLIGASPSDPPHLLAAELQARTGATVVMTLGAAGTLVADGAGSRRFAAHPVPAVDTVGAGDAFCGTLAAHLAAGRTLAVAARWANAAGALAVTVAGAEPSMPTAQAVAGLLASTPSPPDHDGKAEREELQP